MSFTDSTNLSIGRSRTGLTSSLRAALVAPDGTIDPVLRDISTGFREFGGGIYQWSYGAFPDAFAGTAPIYIGALGAASDFSGVDVVSVVTPERPGGNSLTVEGSSTSVIDA